MALELDDYVFFHMGRSGGHTLRKHMAAESSLVRELGSFHATPNEIGDAMPEGKKSFTIVRHPFAWLSSLWRHTVFWGPFEEDDYLRGTYALSFEEFLINLLSKHGADMINIPYHEYADKVDIVLRLEHMKEDLALIGHAHLAEKLNDGAIDNTPPQFLNRAARCNVTLLKTIYEKTFPWFERFGYEPDIEKYEGPSVKLLNLSVDITKIRTTQELFTEIRAHTRTATKDENTFNYNLISPGGQNALAINFYLTQIGFGTTSHIVWGKGMYPQLSLGIGLLVNSHKLVCAQGAPLLCDHIQTYLTANFDPSIFMPAERAAVIVDVCLPDDSNIETLKALSDMMSQYGEIVDEYTMTDAVLGYEDNQALQKNGRETVLKRRFFMRVAGTARIIVDDESI